AARLEGHGPLLRPDARRGDAALAGGGAAAALDGPQPARRARGDAVPLCGGPRAARHGGHGSCRTRRDAVARGRRDGGVGGRDARRPRGGGGTRRAAYLPGPRGARGDRVPVAGGRTAGVVTPRPRPAGGGRGVDAGGRTARVERRRPLEHALATG